MTRARALAAVVAVCACASVALIASRSDPHESPAVPVFVDETTSSGVQQVYDGEFEFFVGGGVATFDCSGDGLPELFMAGGSNPASLFVNHSVIGGGLRFERKPSTVTDLVAVTGAYPLELDGDGITDLVILRRGGNAVLRGTGDCGFENVTRSLGLDPGSDWTTAFTATWEKDAVLPTLVFGNYLVPGTYDCAASRMWRPTDNRYRSPIDLPGHCTLSALFSDWGHDGNVDLRMSNDRNYDRNAREQLWRVHPGENPREYTTADGWRNLTIWGMGIASEDITGDGRPEVFLTSQADNKLQTLDAGVAGPAYSDIALERGVTAQRPYTGDAVLPSTAWHPQFADVNNDGRVDLFITKGNVDAQVDYAAQDPNNLLLARPDGTFTEAGDRAGIVNGSRSRGAALVDLNLDGMLDMVVMNRRVPAEIRRNVGTGTHASPVSPGHWVQFRLHQHAPNTGAFGAWVDVRTADGTRTHEVTVGGGHASGGSGWIHAGIGKYLQADIRVTYPGAQPGPWMTVTGDAYYDVTRGSDVPEVWDPRG